MAVKIKKQGNSKIAIDMTPMIDIVFQLLTFFVMTLKIATAEGDFNIRMPLAAPRAGPPDPNQLPPMKLFLKADSAGKCARVVMNDSEFSGGDRWTRLHNHVAGIVGDGSLASSAEVELVCDYNLHYEHVIEAITAVSGEMRDGQIVKLVEKIKFSPPVAQ
ncbi:Biopolymer transport protein ExbD/TolR [Anatilimnocola aggregata]|uniref:Biopolymer transport protein ExbD/TolR n=1 Tax=Anatilimnocola aggregata TaxID=2528021 RepID=A0A517Y546_9BACT|nr:biopolymer transporter ExbD [Anatilimnocola aggregata]QDU25320.1 Biopolymer transport protein ExbD/TolR [Anatilimnocola aggregata]